MSVLLLFLGLVLFAGLVVVHEFGHYIVAKRNGITVEEFGLGFPPRAKVLGKRKGTTYTVNWIPFGGFVKLKGEHDADKTKGSFGAASLWAKSKVMLAGVGMNLLVALLLFTILALVGMPKLVDNQFTVPSDTKVIKQEVLIGDVTADSPAAKAGLQINDQLISLAAANQVPTYITGQSQLQDFTKGHAGQTVEVTYKHQNQIVTKSTTLLTRQEVEASQKTKDPKGYLGVVVPDTAYTLQRSTYSAPVVAVGLMRQLTALTFQGLGGLFTNLFHGHLAQASNGVTGPVGIVYIIKDGSFLGYQFILLITAIISLTLAIFNLFPIPALDGGRLYLILFFRAIRRPLTADKEDAINGVAFLVLFALIIVITVVDVKRNHVWQSLLHVKESIIH